MTTTYAPPVNAFPASERQISYIKSLLTDMAKLDRDLAVELWQAVDATARANGLTGGRDGSASTMIGNLIAELKTLRAAAKAGEAPASFVAPTSWGNIPWATRPSGSKTFYVAVLLPGDEQIRYYALKLKKGFYTVKMFVSDRRVDVKWARAKKIMDAVALDPMAAGRAFAEGLERCIDCGRLLTDENSQNQLRGDVCQSRR